MGRGGSGNDKTPRGTSRGSASSVAGGSGASVATAGGALGREVGGILLLALALFLALSLGSFQLGGRLTGPGGALVALGLYAGIGMGAWVAAVALGTAAVRLLAGRPVRLRSWEVAGYLAATAFAAILLHLATGTLRTRGYSTGGLFGEYAAELLVALLGTVGTVLLAATGLLLSLVATTPLTASGLYRGGQAAARGGWRGFSGVALALFPDRGSEDDDAVPGTTSSEATRPMAAPTRGRGEGAVPVPVPAGETRRSRVVPAPASDDAPLIVEASALAQRRRRRGAAPAADPAATQQDDIASHKVAPPAGPTRRGDGPGASPGALEVASVSLASAAAAEGPAALPLAVEPLAAAEPASALPIINVPARRVRAGTEPGQGAVGPEPVAPADDRTEVNAAPPAAVARAEAIPPAIAAPARPAASPAPRHRGPLDYIRLGSGEFRAPDLGLLDYPEAAQAELDRQAMLDLAGRLEKTLADYGVRGRVSEIHPGPVVTMYEFVPQAGTKLSKITALSNDLAMALEALKVRIVAPIPGKAAVGIEVPNRVRETVYFKEIVASDAFARATRSKLAMALGKDIVGNPVVVDLAKMPHLLIAGTTGSGKSVSVNAMICSLLFNASPEEVKLIMIDPKMLELSIYEGIPHLLLPVVTDPKKANLALRWAVEEMERRYDLISKAGVRDIASYNKKLEKRLAEAPARAAAQAVPSTITVTIGSGPEAEELEVEASIEAVEAAGGVVDGAVLDDISGARAALQAQLELPAVEPERKLPYIVIVIDEFADLMMVASKEVEQSVARIAQKARAAGIHLMLATQRPSVDVITGLIKANFPSRIAFQVASKIDARTILDQQGAESLLGMGDMLFSDRGLALRRVHGPLVTDVEIHRVVDHLKAQGKPVYDLEILKPRPEDGEEGGEDEDWSDEMYDQAVAVVSEMTHASTSMLQRRLRLGYNRAARMIDRMEREGIVGPADGARPREVLVRSHAA